MIFNKLIHDIWSLMNYTNNNLYTIDSSSTTILTTHISIKYKNIAQIQSNTNNQNPNPCPPVNPLIMPPSPPPVSAVLTV